MTSTILIVDPSDECASIELLFEQLGYVVKTASTALAASHRCEEGTVSLVIVDPELPDHKGPKVCRLLRLATSAPILVLTPNDNIHDKVQAFELGADDYLLKPYLVPELLARGKALIRRSRSGSANLSYGDIRMDVSCHRATFQDRDLPLTLREFQLLARLLQRPQTVYSKEQLLRHLWGWDGPADTNVVEVHISAIRAKLGSRGRRLIRTVRGVGYALG